MSSLLYIVKKQNDIYLTDDGKNVGIYFEIRPNDFIWIEIPVEYFKTLPEGWMEAAK